MATIQFDILDKEDGKKKIGIIDDYLVKMKPFERALKMGVNKDITIEKFITFLKENVCEWTIEEKKKVNYSIDKLKTKLQELNIIAPEEIFIIKTSGKEEWNSAYTRNNLIMLPQKKITNYSKEGLFELLIHEFFHIYSRFNDNKRKRLYELLGFQFIDSSLISNEIRELTIINPDALQTVCTEVEYKNRLIKVSPLIMIKKENVDDTKDILESIRIKLLVLGSEHIIDAEEVEEYIKKISVNTKNIQHPEETLAENFTYLLSKKNDIINSKILEEIERVLTE